MIHKLHTFFLPLFLLFIILTCEYSIAQESKMESNYLLQGSVLDAQNLKLTVPNVQIFNLTSKQSFISDQDGKFQFKINENDTLRFKQLGYHTKFYIFKKILNVENYSVQILMTSDTITLKPFVYKSITKEKAIQNAFMNSYIRDSLRMIEYLRKMMNDENKTFLENVVSAYSSPVTFIYDQFGKKARQRSRIDRYRQIIKDENEKRDPDYAK